MRQGLMVAGVAVGLMLGYATGGRSAQAQAPGLPIAVGEALTLHYGEHTVRCDVDLIHGDFVRCGRQEPRFGPRPRFQEETWYNLSTVQALTTTTGR